MGKANGPWVTAGGHPLPPLHEMAPHHLNGVSVDTLTKCGACLGPFSLCRSIFSVGSDGGARRAARQPCPAPKKNVPGWCFRAPYGAEVLPP